MSENRRVVGIAEMGVSTKSADVLVTYSLGSCIGLSLYDPRARVGGLLHAMLPVSSLDRSRAAGHPAVFADTGVTALLQAVFDRGARRETLLAVVAGASNQMDENGLFRIGERNYTIVRKLLWKNGILIHAEDVGGSATRTLSLEMATGRALVKVDGVTRVVATTGG